MPGSGNGQDRSEAATETDLVYPRPACGPSFSPE